MTVSLPSPNFSTTCSVNSHVYIHANYDWYSVWSNVHSTYVSFVTLHFPSVTYSSCVQNYTCRMLWCDSVFLATVRVCQKDFPIRKMTWRCLLNMDSMLPWFTFSRCSIYLQWNWPLVSSFCCWCRPLINWYTTQQQHDLSLIHI